MRYISRLTWSNPGKRVSSLPTAQCSSYWKGRLPVDLDYSRQLSYLFIIVVYSLISNVFALFFTSRIWFCRILHLKLKVWNLSRSSHNFRTSQFTLTPNRRASYFFFKFQRLVTHTDTDTDTHTHMYIYVSVDVCVCMCVCMCVRVQPLRFIYIYIYMGGVLI